MMPKGKAIYRDLRDVNLWGVPWLTIQGKRNFGALFLRRQSWKFCSDSEQFVHFLEPFPWHCHGIASILWSLPWEWSFYDTIAMGMCYLCAVLHQPNEISTIICSRCIITLFLVAICKKVTSPHGNVLKNCTFTSKPAHIMITAMEVIIIWRQCHGNVMGMAPKSAEETQKNLVINRVTL